MKRLKKMIIVLMVCALCMAMAATSVFAAGKRLNALSKDEVFDCIWKYIEQSNNGLTASLMYDECKAFVDQLEMPSKNYDTSDGYNDFKKWYVEKNNGLEIHTYNEKVIEYLKQHPGTELIWTTGSSNRIDGKLHVEYTVYDNNVLVDKADRTVDTPQMQYNSKNISNLTIWTYDIEKNEFVGKDINGNMIKTVYAYSKPYGIEEISKSSEVIVQESITSKANTSQIENSKLAESVISNKPEQSMEEPKAVEETSTTVSESSDSNFNENNAVTIILIISCGIIISAVFASIIIRQKKKRSM